MFLLVTSKEELSDACLVSDYNLLMLTLAVFEVYGYGVKLTTSYK